MDEERNCSCLMKYVLAYLVNHCLMWEISKLHLGVYKLGWGVAEYGVREMRLRQGWEGHISGKCVNGWSLAFWKFWIDGISRDVQKCSG